MKRFYLPGMQTARQQRLDKIQHFLAAGLLLLATFSRFQNNSIELSGFDGLYIAVNLITALANILMGIVGQRIQSEDMKSRLTRGVFLLTGAALLADSADSIRAGTKYLHFLKLFAAVLYIMLAIFYSRLRKMRRIEFSKETLLLYLSPIRRSSFAWSDIKDINLRDDKLTILQTSGESTSISVSGISTQAAFLAALEKHAKKWNIRLDKQ